MIRAIERAPLAVFQHPKMAVFGILIGLVVALVGLTRLQFEDGFDRTFASNTASFSELESFRRAFPGGRSTIAILVRADHALTQPDLIGLQDFVLDTQFVDGVSAVFSLFSLQTTDPETGARTALFGGLEDQHALTAQLAIAAQPTLSGLQVLTDSKRETVVVLTLDTAQPPAETLSEIRSLATRFARTSGLETEVTGVPLVRNYVIAQVQIDQAVINVLGAIFGFAVSLVIFRSFWIALLNGIAPVIALVLSLGLMGILGFSINVLNTALPVLVLVLASSDCTHITYEICAQGARSSNWTRIVPQALLRMTPACVLTSLTTIFAFASLGLSSSPIIQDLAISGALSVAVALLAVLVIHPLVFRFALRFAVIQRAVCKPLRASNREQTRRRHFEAILGNARRIGLGSVILAAVLVVALWPLRTEYRYTENIHPDHALAQSLTRFEASHGPLATLSIPMMHTQGAPALTPALFAQLETIHAVLDAAAPGQPVTSLLTLSRTVQSQDPRDLTEALAALPEPYQRQLISADGRTLVANLHLSTAMNASQVREISKAIQAGLDQLPPGPLTVGQPTGPFHLAATQSDAMIKQLVLSFLLAAISCPVFIGLWYRRVDFAILAILPNALPILTIAALLMLSGAQIQFTSALALTIAFGIAVDDTVHVFNRIHLIAGRGTGPSGAGRIPLEDVQTAMVQVAPALITTTLILSAGLITVLWSALPMVVLFGLLCVATFVLALLADLVILPACFALIAAQKEPK